MEAQTKLIEKNRLLKDELVEWLNTQVPSIEYDTFDLSHDFAYILRDKLDQIAFMEASLDKQIAEGKDDDVKSLYKAMGEWSCLVFPDSDSVGHLHKLLEETKEAINDPGNIEEYADCLLVIMAAAYRAEIAFDHLIRTAEHKLDVNKSRKWDRKENGIYQHIEEGKETPFDFDAWYSGEESRFHSGQFDERQIAYAAFKQGMKFSIPFTPTQLEGKEIPADLPDISEALELASKKSGKSTTSRKGKEIPAGAEEMVQISKWKLVKIEDVFRIANNIHHSSLKKTCFDRCLIKAWDWVKEAMQSNTKIPARVSCYHCDHCDEVCEYKNNIE